jgi:mono/diheme cytochrome c family protein
MRGVWTLLIVGCAVLFLSVAVAAQKKGGDPKLAALKNPVALNAASIKAGQAVYAKNCRHCHGLRGKGDGPLAPKNPKPADLTDDKWDHGSSDGEIYTLILNGAPAPMSEMKPMKGTLPPTQIWQVVNYIRSIGPQGAAKAAQPSAKSPPPPAKK